MLSATETTYNQFCFQNFGKCMTQFKIKYVSTNSVELLYGNSFRQNDESNELRNESTIFNNTNQDSTFNQSEQEPGTREFFIQIVGSEFDKLIVTKTIKDRTRTVGNKMRLRLKKDEWTRWISEKIFNETRIQCGYYFKYHSINTEGNSGHMNGSCKCGSKIEVYMSRSSENVVTLKCQTTYGDKTCGKIYLRGEARSKVADMVNIKSAYAFRAEEANKLMLEGEREPAILPTLDVLRAAKYKKDRNQYEDKDPFTSIRIMKSSSMKHIIYNLSCAPFMVHYSTKHQDTIYRVISKQEGFSIAIDATGSLCRKIVEPDGKKSGYIFLYTIVAQTPNGSTPIAQMLSERQTTSAILYWLNEWISNAGLPFPREIITDGSKALIGACVRAFTPSLTINHYANSLAQNVLPDCYIRLDVAHFLKKYADFLASERVPVKQFYLAAIGKLIVSQNKDEAKNIVYSIMTIALNEFDGKRQSGEDSICQKQKEYLFTLLENINEYNEYDSENKKNNNCDFDEEDDAPNVWHNWALEIKSKVEEEMDNSPGTNLNAYWLPRIVKYLCIDLRFLPMWSCIVRDLFGHGRVPASSACVESEFKNIKTLMLRDATLPMRADCFIKRHIKHVSGVTKVFDAGLQEKLQHTLITEQQSEDAIQNDLNTMENNGEKNELGNKCDLEPTCPVCQTTGVEDGAHKCIVCKKPVHAIEECSLPFKNSEEGYGQKRICHQCNTNGNTSVVLELREQENWGGLVKNVSKKRKRGTYLQERFPVKRLLNKPLLTNIPIIKSGNSKELRAIRKKNWTKGEQINIDVINTCAFDSILQLFIVTARDSPCFVEKTMPFAKNNLFFKLVLKIHEKGIKSSSYRLRMEILSEIFETSGNKTEGCCVIDCQTTTTALCEKLFDFAPSFIETKVCPSHCNDAHYKCCVKIISEESITAENLNVMVESEFNMDDTLCSQCGELTTRVIEANDKFLLFEVVGENTSIYEDPSIQLINLPTSIKLSFMTREFKLRGLINYKAPLDYEMTQIGHYTAFYLRNESWFEADNNEIRRSATTIVNPHILMYTI